MEPFVADILEALPDGAALLGENQAVLRFNRRLQEMLGVSPGGRTLLELTRNADAQHRAADAIGGKGDQMELTLAAPPHRTLRLHFQPIAGGALLVARDITESKRMEQARRDFVANASHELRTPVTAIASAAETLQGGAVDDPNAARSFVEIIARHAERLGHLARDLLDLSRIESGEWRAELEPVDARGLATTVLDLYREQARQRRVTLDNQVPGGHKVRADRRALEQVLVNLVDNAIKHTPDGGRVGLAGEPSGAALVLSVSDSGPGIERRHLDRIFERFYRADSGRARDAGGTGLGLSIVKHLVQAQGGEVGVESGASGSRFWIRLPVA
jgi:two-component system phosphate regulon sensor histidine kinase PhoR